MPDSSEIDDALAAKLIGDSVLMALMTDGVYFDEASQNKTRFVVVSLVTAFDEGMFGKRAFEDATYLVKAVALGTSGADVKAAAARIDALLELGTMTVAGYGLMSMRRVERVRYTEVDSVDASIRWQHRGGRYRVMVSPN